MLNIDTCGFQQPHKTKLLDDRVQKEKCAGPIHENFAVSKIKYIFFFVQELSFYGAVRVSRAQRGRGKMGEGGGGQVLHLSLT